MMSLINFLRTRFDRLKAPSIADREHSVLNVRPCYLHSQGLRRVFEIGGRDQARARYTLAQN